MIRFFGGRVMTLANGIETQDIEVWTEGSKIVFVGKPKAEELDGKVFEREYDLKGNLLMPSFKNAHTHSAMTFLRSYADDMPLQDWLFKQIFPMEAKLDGEKVYWLTKLAILEYLTTGCTAAFDMYFELDDYVKACIESGFRSVLCGAVSGDKSNLERLENNYLKYNNVDPLISFMLGFHAEYTCEKELMEGVGELACPSSVVTSILPSKPIGVPCVIRIKPTIRESGNRIRVQLNTRKFQKLPIVLVVLRLMDFIIPAIAAIPVAAVINWKSMMTNN